MITEVDEGLINARMNGNFKSTGTSKAIGGMSNNVNMVKQNIKGFYQCLDIVIMLKMSRR